MKRKTNPAKRDAKKPYRTPKLMVHGSLRMLTGPKGGNNSDGGGKPQTRTFGGNA